MKLINEAKRMQQLAGLLKEDDSDDSSGYSYEYKEGPGATPQEITSAIKQYKRDKFTWDKAVKKDFYAMAKGEAADVKSDYYPKWKKSDFEQVINAVEGEAQVSEGEDEDLSLPVDNEYISSLENNKPIFIYRVNDRGHKEPVPVTKDMLIDIQRDYRENFPGSPSDFARERDIPVEYIGKILAAGRYFNPDYN